MRKNKQLAIIIPAYKNTFLKETLDSISHQSCKDFTLYIGDDCSPYELYSIIEPYKTKLNIVYKRFDTNLGGTDLVAQWERCISMSHDEPYIWLFSDDDIMGKYCVENFYHTIKKNSKNKHLFHFDIKVINDDNSIISAPTAYPNELNSFSYYKGKMSGKYMSLVVENIFSRYIYNKYGKFQNFDMAWGSDTATWIKFSKDVGFTNIHGEYVYWRSGSYNISPDMSAPIANRKMTALVNFFNWTFEYFSNNNINCIKVNIRAFISRAAMYSPFISKNILKKCIKNFCKGHKCKVLYFPILLAIKIKKYI